MVLKFNFLQTNHPQFIDSTPRGGRIKIDREIISGTKFSGWLEYLVFTSNSQLSQQSIIKTAHQS
jgi:hypothetical protein